MKLQMTISPINLRLLVTKLTIQHLLVTEVLNCSFICSAIKKNVLMKLLKTLFTLPIILIWTSCTAKNNATLKQYQYNGKSYTYAIQLPKGYDASKEYPVLIGPSEVEGENIDSFYWKGVKDTEGWILVSYPIYTATKRIDEIKALLEHLKSTYNIEGNKFHTVCYSANSASIFDLVIAIPGYFPGITGMAGNPGTTNKEQLKKLKGVKVQFVVGDKDTYWMNSAKSRHQLLLELGVESTLEIIKNGRHIMTLLVGKGFLEKATRLR